MIRLVELATVQAPMQVASVVAAVLGIQESPGQSITQSIAALTRQMRAGRLSATGPMGGLYASLRARSPS